MNIYAALLGLASAYSIWSLTKLFQSVRWLSQSQKELSVTTQTAKFFVLIPLLREQTILRDNFEIFSKLVGDYTLVYITTQVEDNAAEGSVQTTAELLSYLKDVASFPFIHVHYPEVIGSMALQLNFAVQYLKTQRIISQNDYIVTYNADSNIPKDTLVKLNSFIQQHNYPPVIQQSALFVQNYNSFHRTVRGLLLRNIALLQSHWTLVHEIPRLRRTTSGNVFTRYCESGHVVGHGLIIKHSVLERAGMFPTRHTNEDMPLGYYLGNLGIPIKVFPVLEIAESPRSLIQVIRQYTTWFYGTCAYPSYCFYFIQIHGFTFRACVTALRNSVRAYLWPFLGLLWLYLMFYPIFAREYVLLMLTCLTFVIQYVLGFIFTHSFARTQLSPSSEGLERVSLFQMILIFPAYLLHTVGPARGLFRICRKTLFGRAFEKEKTER